MVSVKCDFNDVNKKQTSNYHPMKSDLIIIQREKSSSSSMIIKLSVLGGIMALLLLLAIGGTMCLMEQRPNNFIVSIGYLQDESSAVTNNLTFRHLQDNKLLPPIKYYIGNQARLDDISTMRRERIRKMMLHAWNNYVEYAWGENELKPIRKQGNRRSIFGNTMLGATIVDALDTLYIMGLTAEFEKGQKWIAENLDVNKVKTDFPVFETNVRFIGGLLSCFSLTGDKMFLEKANQIAKKLLPAFETETGIPKALVDSEDGFSKNYGWITGGCSILSEVGGLHLEFSYLSDLTNNPLFRGKVDQIRKVIESNDKPHGLYSNYLDPETGYWCRKVAVSIGEEGDTFYEYLLKSWLQSGQEDQDARRIFDEAMNAIIQYLLKVSHSGLSYMSRLIYYDAVEPKMSHLACFSGGLFGLAAETLKNNMSSLYMEVAENLTKTCHESYVRTKAQLGPEAFYFTERADAEALRWEEKNYKLRSEVVESYFIMWRLTKDEKYREWGWEVVKALEEHCRVANGYTGIASVYTVTPSQDDIQQTYFLAATLKYLYLLFSDDDLISLDEWVFNTEAHPLPIKGVNSFYRA